MRRIKIPKRISASELKARHKAARMAEKKGLGRVIARRALSEEGSDQETIVSIGAPRRIRGGDRICPFQIDSIIDSRVQFGFGVDSIQALQSTLQGIHVGLKKTGRNFNWTGIAGTGFPPQIPGLMGGKRFEARLETEILREQRRASMDRLRVLKGVRKKEIAAFETELRLLKKTATQPRWWADKNRLKAEIAQGEVNLLRFKKNLEEWEESKKRKNKATASVVSGGPERFAKDLVRRDARK